MMGYSLIWVSSGLLQNYAIKCSQLPREWNGTKIGYQKAEITDI